MESSFHNKIMNSNNANRNSIRRNSGVYQASDFNTHSNNNSSIMQNGYSLKKTIVGFNSTMFKER